LLPKINNQPLLSILTPYQQLFPSNFHPTKESNETALRLMTLTITLTRVSNRTTTIRRASQTKGKKRQQNKNKKVIITTTKRGLLLHLGSSTTALIFAFHPSLDSLVRC